VLVAVSAAVAAKPGNSPNAKSCQKDGWMGLYTHSGQPFSNGGDCAFYTAQGGQLIVKAALTPSQGTYSTTSGVWTVGTVTTTNPQTLQIQARVDSATTQTNTATIASSDQFDPTTADNASSVTITVS
jgi:hypothetical protein